ncbi:TrkA family potassium uptake protein [Dysgonomonas sp. 521]|uniref:potassium channel family protein n=1 Tax=Dysgonomonas sp. 521 TaxID=2302932 RepID=UPI0013D2BEDF|nr:TrkA family potassium uptake protein [Dysgonomonas sp. 521]NDV97120.1 TrkA family potassium uptake protein [Dysgonomonas sp. 521]
MKYIIVGLGVFGSSLAEKLVAQGNEVIGVDSKMQRVNELKDKITHVVCLDVKDASAVETLPLRNTDVVIICIGEDQGANIMATAMFKNMNVKRLIGRSLNPLHENVLQAIGVNEIVRPEEETAERWAKKLTLRGMVDSFELNKNYSIVEVIVPDIFIGRSIEEVGFRKEYNILVLTIVKNVEEQSIIGKTRIVADVQDIPKPDTVLEKDDILVIYGSNKNIKQFIGKSKR